MWWTVGDEVSVACVVDVLSWCGWIDSRFEG